MKVSILCAALSLYAPYAGAADTSAATFPVVDSATQKARDEDRLQILQDEKAEEMNRLNKAKAELTAAQTGKRPAGEIDKLAEALHRHEANVAALNQEISRTGQQKTPAPPVRLTSTKAPALAKPAGEATNSTAPAPFWDVYRRQANSRSE